MKRFILILLVCAMLVGCLAACDIGDNQPNRQPESSGNNVYSGNPIKQTSTTSKNNDLIIAVEKYLVMYNASIDRPTPSTIAGNIDIIKSGKQPLLVSFDSLSFYYLCAYYNPEHDNAYEEKLEFCCVDKYTWVVFDDYKDIQDSHNNEKFIVAFQINQSLFVSDITSEEIAVPDIEHFQIFETKFENNYNVNPPIVFDDTFVYLNDKFDANILFHSTETTIPCVVIGGQYYIKFIINTTYLNGETHTNKDLNHEFGKYYDVLIDLIQPEKHSETIVNEFVFYYGLLGVRDVASVILS